MPLFATCTIANAILALGAPPGAGTSSPWFRAVPLRFDTLASSRLACRIPVVCCRALGTRLPVQCRRFCLRAGLPGCSAGLRRAWPQVWRVCVAAQLRPRSATAAVRQRIWMAPWPDRPCGSCRWTRPGMARRMRCVDGTAQCLRLQQNLRAGTCSCKIARLISLPGMP